MAFPGGPEHCPGKDAIAAYLERAAREIAEIGRAAAPPPLDAAPL
jgi:hypothetical protein